ncbi:MAG: hypothetical protein ACE5ET_09915 [Gammaproteobacteria bacterium]
MTFYIKAWPDNSATLMTELGQILWTFPTLDDALNACRDWYSMHEVRTEYEAILPERLDGTASYAEW